MVEKKLKECPYCGEEILETAKKCKHCGEFLDEELRKGNKSESNGGGSINYEGCTEVKRGFLQGDPKIECPKCGYKWKAKKIGASSDTVGCLLLLLWIIPGLIYYLVKGKGAYVCPQCGENHLRKTGSSIDFVGALVVGFGALMIIGLIASGGWNGGTSRSTTTTTTTVNQNQNLSLTEHYNKHKNYIWNVVQEGVKLITTNQVHNFSGPTFAGEVGENFLVEGDDNGNHFACVFEKADNQRGMNLVNCAWVVD